MSVSKLATVHAMSPNHSGKRTHAIDRITYHCFVGQVTAKRGVEVFMPAKKRASCQYVVGYDGSIGACVDEDNRSWCTSSAPNDQRAITIEIASGTVHPYEIRDAAYDAVKELTIDIMQRHGKTKLVFIPDKNTALAYTPAANELLITQHRWFAAKACPGAFIISVLQDLTDAVNANFKQVSSDVVYRVQIGAYSRRANADRALAMIRNAGFRDAYINTSDNYFRVQVGAFGNMANAEALRDKVKDAGFCCCIKTTSRTTLHIIKEDTK